MYDLEIQIILVSQYRVFDRSGNIPFSIVFGLVRRSRNDNDPRPLVLNTKNSIFDVPYALSHKLLQLRVHDETRKTDIEVDIGQPISIQTKDGERNVMLQSPIGRIKSWRKSLSVFHYRVDPGSELAKLFDAGKKYTICCNPNNKTLGGTFTWGEGTEQGNSRLVCRKPHGKATFTVVSSLTWPPRLQTRMNWNSDTSRLEITVANYGEQVITVQTRDRQHFLVPRLPMDNEGGYPPDDSRPRIIDSQGAMPTATLQVINTATNEVVRGPSANTPACSGVYQAAKHDPRPKLDNLVTLKPGEPLAKSVDISTLFDGLPDGTYNLRMEPRGMWWCPGSREDFAARGEDRVPRDLYQTLIPPVVLECDENTVEVHMDNGCMS